LMNTHDSQAAPLCEGYRTLVLPLASRTSVIIILK
jgi:hypothetical protein